MLSEYVEHVEFDVKIDILRVFLSTNLKSNSDVFFANLFYF